MKWDPAQYALFSDHRLRPALDLLARIPVSEAGRVVDLGCGPGTVTTHLVGRWPGAEVIGVDGSREMLDEARSGRVVALRDVRFVEADLARWEITGGTDVLYSNATLHWLGDHSSLFPRLVEMLRGDGVLAVQMPRNFGAPSHQIAAELAGSARWRAKLGHLVQPAPVREPGYYYDLLRARLSRLELWETEYIQPLTGVAPVLQWIKGTWLRQFLALLQPDEALEFENDYAKEASRAYPARADGTTILPFRRLFVIGIR